MKFMMCLCVAETSSYFHALRVTIQHAQEKTLDHAKDERPTGKVVRSSFVSQWTTKMIC